MSFWHYASLKGKCKIISLSFFPCNYGFLETLLDCIIVNRTLDASWLKWYLKGVRISFLTWFLVCICIYACTCWSLVLCFTLGFENKLFHLRFGFVNWLLHLVFLFMKYSLHLCLSLIVWIRNNNYDIDYGSQLSVLQLNEFKDKPNLNMMLIFGTNIDFLFSWSSILLDFVLCTFY